VRNWQLIAERLERDGPLISTCEAAKLIPNHRGRRNHASSHALNRWITAGKGGVFLDGIKAGRGWATTKQAVLRFLVACSEAEAGKQQMITPEELHDRERRMREAKARLRAAGVKC